MTNYDIAFSLNRSISITANTYEEAEEKLKNELKKEGIDFEQYTLDVFDVEEEEE